jgi:hypothetical protein
VRIAQLSHPTAAAAAAQRQTQGAVLGGTFCAHYLYMPCVAVLIKEFFPNARIVAVYREPTCRAISSFLARRAAVLGLGNIINVTDAETHKLLRRCTREHSLAHVVNFDLRYFHRGRDHGPKATAWDVFKGGFAVKNGSGYEGNEICWLRPELSLLYVTLSSSLLPRETPKVDAVSHRKAALLVSTTSLRASGRAVYTSQPYSLRWYLPPESGRTGFDQRPNVGPQFASLNRAH